MEMDKKAAMNGDCSPPPKERPSIELKHSSNIDDIATPSDLKFDEEFDFEDPDIIEKRKQIEDLLVDYKLVPLEVWQRLARSKGGLICDEYRYKIWPILVGVTDKELTDPPSLEDFSTHSEYNQVVLDVARSLKRFPPGVPYARRVALQDQLTALILRVLVTDDSLRYYQGYHDVAVTLLLVCGARAGGPLLRRLSRGPLRPFLRPSMAPTQRLLAALRPLVARVRPDLARVLEQSQVGTMFALPWFLTWFGHSLPRYRDVVRLYDYFLCAAPLAPVYLTAAILIYREKEIFECECDMAMMHCLLSRLPDNLPFDDLLREASDLYDAFPPDSLREDVNRIEREEEEQRRRDEALRVARVARRGRGGGAWWGGGVWWAAQLRRRRGALAAAALLAALLYWRPDLLLR